MSCVYGCLPGNYNWSIIFRGKNDDGICIELSNLSKELDGTYRLNPTCPSIQTYSGGGDPNWAKQRERIITETKTRMVKNALGNGVSRWINNAMDYLKINNIIDDYKEQFPQIYNYLIDRNNIPYEKMSRIHYDIVETITKCENSSQVKDKRKTKLDTEKIEAKKWIDYYKKKDYECNMFFIEIEKNHTKSAELYDEYFILKNLKQSYNKYNLLYNILYRNSDKYDIFIIGDAKKIISMRKTDELEFLEYLNSKKIQYIKSLLLKANPLKIGDEIKIEFEEL
jgi:hypothetical protein